MNIHRVAATAVVAVVVSAGLSACAASPGIPSQPVTLTLFHIDGGPELDPGVDWFVEAVDEASDGAITVEVVRGCCDDAVSIEEDLVAQVAGGGADLGWVGTRVFESLGVDALLPLTAPLLVDGYALQEEILGSDVAHAAVGEVGATGVTGLALMPGQMRRPLAVESPLLGPEDWAGVSVASFHSPQNARAFEALGAEPLDVTFEQRDVGIQDKTILALENSLTMQDLDREDTLPYATPNVALWPRVSALIANPDSPAVVDADVRELLLDAAASVVARTAEFAAIDQAALESACESGARFAEASAAQLEALRAVVQPIYGALADGETTSELYDAIVEARESHAPETPTVPSDCTGVAATAGSTTADGDPSVLNGGWATREYTSEDLRAQGFSETDAKNAAGTFTLSFDDGAFELRAAHVSGQMFGCDGSYTVEGDRVTVNYRAGGDCGPGGVFFTADFAVDDSTLTLSDMGDALESDVYLFSSSPLVKVE